MTIWLTSRYRAVLVSIFCIVLIIVVLAFVISRQGVSERTIAASLLVLSFIIFGLGGILYTGRAMLNWQIEDIATHLRWERGSVITATLVTALGFILLEDMLHATGDAYLARLGTMTYLFAAVILVVAETNYLSNGEWNYTQIVIYVFLAFLAEAAIGLALLQTELLASWVGWVTILWNVGVMLIMLIVRPDDMYFPVIHYVAPLIIGISLLASGWI